MEEFKHILRQHAARYPLMEPTDAVKLAYQNEFGGGHLVRDPEAALMYLRREYASTAPDSHIPLYESLGGGILRVNLAAVKEQELESLGQVFLASAASHRGEPARFREKLDILRAVTAEGVFAFSPEELEAYLAAYEKAGSPMVSHSQRYRQAYKPAYRVVLGREAAKWREL